MATSSLVESFRGIIPDVSVAEANQWIAKANGSIDRAIALYFDKPSIPSLPSTSPLPPLPSSSSMVNGNVNGGTKRKDVVLASSTITSTARNASPKRKAARASPPTTTSTTPLDTNNGGKQQSMLSSFFTRPASRPPIVANGNGQVPSAASSSSLPSPQPSESSSPSSLSSSEGGEWTPGEAVPYLHMARTFHQVEHEPGRNKVVNHLTLMYWCIIRYTPADLLPSIWLSLNSIAPSYENVELGIGASMLTNAISAATGRSRASLANEYVRQGDLGLVAQVSRVNQSTLIKPVPLTVRSFYQTLISLSQLRGAGVQQKKISIIKNVISSCRYMEVTYIIRTLLADLRIGAVERTALTAVARACVLDAHYSIVSNRNDGLPIPTGNICTPERVACASIKLKDELKLGMASLKRCYTQYPNLRVIVPALLSSHGAIFQLDKLCALRAGIPMKPMLGKITRGIDDALSLLYGQPFTCQVKYDGLRAQIHMTNNGQIHVFSRHLEDQSKRWPDLLPILHHAILPLPSASSSSPPSVSHEMSSSLPSSTIPTPNSSSSGPLISTATRTGAYRTFIIDAEIVAVAGRGIITPEHKHRFGHKTIQTSVTATTSTSKMIASKLTSKAIEVSLDHDDDLVPLPIDDHDTEQSDIVGQNNDDNDEPDLTVPPSSNVIKPTAVSTTVPTASSQPSISSPATSSPLESDSYRVLSFQSLSTRSRKQPSPGTKYQSRGGEPPSSSPPMTTTTTTTTGAAGGAIPTNGSKGQVSVMVYVFDLLLVDDRSLLPLTLNERRSIMMQTFRETAGAFQFVEGIDINIEDQSRDDEDNECIIDPLATTTDNTVIKSSSPLSSPSSSPSSSSSSSSFSLVSIEGPSSTSLPSSIQARRQASQARAEAKAAKSKMKASGNNNTKRKAGQLDPVRDKWRGKRLTGSSIDSHTHDIDDQNDDKNNHSDENNDEDDDEDDDDDNSEVAILASSTSASPKSTKDSEKKTVVSLTTTSGSEKKGNGRKKKTVAHNIDWKRTR
jgi:hypothetical protein